MKEAEALDARRTLRGRQLYWMIIQYKKTCERMGSIYNIQDLTKLQWKGDKNIAEFNYHWHTYSASVKANENIGDESLEAILLEQLKKSKVLAQGIAHYNRQSRREATEIVRWLSSSSAWRVR